MWFRKKEEQYDLTEEERIPIEKAKEQTIIGIPVPDAKSFDKIMQFVIEYHRLKGRTASVIPTSAMIVSPGQWVMRRAVEIDDEHLIVELPEKTTLRYFTHVKPTLGAIDRSLFERNFFGKQKKGFWYNRCHLIIGHEPITRDFYTGRIADEEKKWQKLLEVGVLIKEDSELAKQHFMRNGEVKSPTGYFIHPEKVELDQHGKPREIYDISDIDAITSEVVIAEEKKLVDNAIAAAFEAYDQDPNRDLKIILLGVGIIITLITLGSFYYMNEIAGKGVATMLPIGRTLIQRLLFWR